MTTIRERDAEYVEALGAGYDRHEHPESECPADVDRRALLAAGDALAEALQRFGSHDRVPYSIDNHWVERGGYLCIGDPCQCGLDATRAEWKAATG